MTDPAAWLGERWNWVLSATALLVAALTGELDAFGLTLGVLAAAQAAHGGLRIERATERIEEIAHTIHHGDQNERIARVEAAIREVRRACRPANRAPERADPMDLFMAVYQAREEAGVDYLPETKRLLDMLVRADLDDEPTKAEILEATERADDECMTARGVPEPPD